MTGERLLELGARATRAALEAGATAAEAFVSEHRRREAGYEANDLKLAKADSELTLGIRVLCGRSLGFAATNEPAELAATAREAVAIARASPPDAANDLPEPAQSGEDATGPDGLFDPAIAGLGADGLTRLAARIADEVRALDSRVTIDRIRVSLTEGTDAICSSRGITAMAAFTYLSGFVMGMAREGVDVGSVAYDGVSASNCAAVESELGPVIRRFVDRAIGALRPRRGRSFRGKVLLLPDAVGEVLADPLLEALAADAVRHGRSPLGPKLGRPIANPAFHLRDPGTRLGFFAVRPFDREGTPRRPLDLIAAGTLASLLYDAYEARRAGRRSTGHAQGSAQVPPRLAACLSEVLPGDRLEADIEAAQDLALVVPRFSGRVEMATGEFSGVVKGGFLLQRGARLPVTETMIAGNLYDALNSVVAVSSDRQQIFGSALYPAVLVDGVAVTAG